MSPQEFTILYNPYTQNTLGFVSDNIFPSVLKIENFDASVTKHFSLYSNPIENLFDNIILNHSSEKSTEKSEYIKYVEDILAQIHQNYFQKIVAAQTTVYDVSLSSATLLQKFNQLKTIFPKAFVFCYYINHSIWIGASPELIANTSHGTFHTISLAGTRSSCSLEPFTHKEIYEQQLVSDYIQSILRSYSQEEVIPVSDTTHFGNIQHIISHYSIPYSSKTNFDSIVHQIHPSPALSGYPIQNAIHHIQKYEPIPNREWYCGSSQFEDNEEFYAFAHIRCAKITANQAIFYAGAGIVNGSHPISEWEETIQKIETIQSVILS